MSAKIYHYNGREYTIGPLAKLVGINVGTLDSRLRSGLSVEQAIAKPPGRKAKTYSYHGEMLSIAQIAARSHLTQQAIAERLHKGWTVEEAADLPKGSYAKHKGRKRKKTPSNGPDEHSSVIERKRWECALKIFGKIGLDPEAWCFRCTVPAREYVFDSDILSWCIRFAEDGNTAELTARYREHGIDSDLRHVYQIVEDKIQEAFMA